LPRLRQVSVVNVVNPVGDTHRGDRHPTVTERHRGDRSHRGDVQLQRDRDGPVQVVELPVITAG